MEDCGSEVESESEFLSKLSDNLLFEILIRLPNKSACRFKVVCKHWFSLISSNYFISNYKNYRCQDTPETFTLVFSLTFRRLDLERNVILSLPQVVNAVSNYSVLSKLLKRKSLDRSLQRHFKRNFKRRNIPLPSENLKIRAEASCHDLLLCSDSLAFYSVINFHTRECITLSHIPRHVRNNRLGHLPGILRYHDPNNISNNEDGRCRFKVILVPNVKSSFHAGNESSRFNVDIYCSERRQWSVVNVDWYPVNFYAFQTPIIAHDRMLHWLNGRSLVSVDPFSDGDLQLKLCRDIILPPVPPKYCWLLLGVSGGHIRVVGRTSAPLYMQEVHVWDLQGCQNKSWLLAHTILLHNSSLYENYVSYLAVHPYDTDVIFVTIKDVIYLFNLRTDRLEEYRKVKLWDHSDPGMSAILEGKASVLLHQWFPSPLPSY